MKVKNEMNEFVSKNFNLIKNQFIKQEERKPLIKGAFVYFSIIKKVKL
jgi:hypothetical protein